MNIEQIISSSDKALEIITLTRVLVDIEPKIAIKKIKFISMILVSKICLNIILGSEWRSSG